MTYEELTEYIIHYLENDKTHNAIMLWRVGIRKKSLH